MSLIESIVEACNLSQLEPYLPEVVQIMLVRLQKGRTIRFTRAFVVFISFVSIKYGSEFVVSLLNRIQDGLFVQIFEHVSSLILCNEHVFIDSFRFGCRVWSTKQIQRNAKFVPRDLHYVFPVLL